MATKAEAYVDTSALIAFLDRSDSYHPLFRRLFSSPPRLVTSALVVAEGHGWFLRRYDRNRAIQFLNFIDELSVLAIQTFDREELTKTSRLVKKFGDQSLTLAGCSRAGPDQPAPNLHLLVDRSPPDTHGREASYFPGEFLTLALCVVITRPGASGDGCANHDCQRGGPAAGRLDFGHGGGRGGKALENSIRQVGVSASRASWEGGTGPEGSLGTPRTENELEHCMPRRSGVC